jgi:hypothetical protein
MNDTPATGATGSSKLDQLAPLSARVYAALEHGLELARGFFEGRRHDPWLFAHLVRYGVLEMLPDAMIEVDDYEIKRNPMCGIEIVAAGSRIKLWKKPAAENKFLQPPGESEARQQFYWQQLTLPGVLSFSPSQDHLAYVWEPSPSGVELFLVKPNGYDDIWKPGEHEWALPIAHPAETLVAATDFAAADLDDDLDIQIQQASDPESGA